MTYKKAPVHLTWDANDYKRVTAYFALLVQIDKRVSKTNSSSHTVKEEPKEIEQPKLKPDIWTRDPTGPFFRSYYAEASKHKLFFFATTFIFNHSLLIKFLHPVQADYDRHYRTHTQQRSVRNTLS